MILTLSGQCAALCQMCTWPGDRYFHMDISLGRTTCLFLSGFTPHHFAKRKKKSCPLLQLASIWGHLHRQACQPVRHGRHFFCPCVGHCIQALCCVTAVQQPDSPPCWPYATYSYGIYPTARSIYSDQSISCSRHVDFNMLKVTFVTFSQSQLCSFHCIQLLRAASESVECESQLCRQLGVFFMSDCRRHDLVTELLISTARNTANTSRQKGARPQTSHRQKA